MSGLFFFAERGAGEVELDLVVLAEAVLRREREDVLVHPVHAIEDRGGRADVDARRLAAHRVVAESERVIGAEADGRAALAVELEHLARRRRALPPRAEERRESMRAERELCGAARSCGAE